MWEKNHPRLGPTLFILYPAYDLTSLLLPPFCGTWWKGEVKPERGVGEKISWVFLHLHTPLHTLWCAPQAVQRRNGCCRTWHRPHTRTLVFEIECWGARWWPHAARKTRKRRERYCASRGKRRVFGNFFAVCCDHSINDTVKIITIGIITIVIIY